MEYPEIYEISLGWFKLIEFNPLSTRPSYNCGFCFYWYLTQTIKKNQRVHYTLHYRIFARNEFIMDKTTILKNNNELYLYVYQFLFTHTTKFGAVNDLGAEITWPSNLKRQSCFFLKI